MDPASRIFSAWKEGRSLTTPENIALGAWPKAVGKRIAAHTKAIKLIRGTLVVEVEDDLWKRNLWSLRYQILRNLESSIGPGLVGDLELRIMPARREPQRELKKALAADEADAIDDPGMRRIYKAARRRESA